MFQCFVDPELEIRVQEWLFMAAGPYLTNVLQIGNNYTHNVDSRWQSATSTDRLPSVSSLRLIELPVQYRALIPVFALFSRSNRFKSTVEPSLTSISAFEQTLFERLLKWADRGKATLKFAIISENKQNDKNEPTALI